MNASPRCEGYGSKPVAVLRPPRSYGLGSGSRHELAGRGECPTCGRLIAFYSESGMVFHRSKLQSLSTQQRAIEFRRRAAIVRDSMAWKPSGSMVVALRWWFRDYGGAEAFRRYVEGEAS